MKYLLITLLILGLCGLTGCGTKAPQGTEKAAIQSARTWLNLVDNARYGQSWDEAASYFKSAISKDQWNNAVRAVRNPLGKTLSREVKTKKYKTSLPGAPDGEYLVIQFKTSFEKE